MRPPRLAAWFLIGLGVANAHAEDWDHDANIESAVGVVVSAYRQDGMAAIEQLVARCYGIIERAGDSDAQLRQLETCASMDFAAWRVDRAKAPAEGRDFTPYFSAELLMGRMERLSSFVTAPGVEDQVLRAWAKAVADALEKSGL
jgi:hypothetical protein